MRKNAKIHINDSIRYELDSDTLFRDCRSYDKYVENLLSLVNGKNIPSKYSSINFVQRGLIALALFHNQYSKSKKFQFVDEIDRDLGVMAYNVSKNGMIESVGCFFGYNKNEFLTKRSRYLDLFNGTSRIEQFQFPSSYYNTKYTIYTDASGINPKSAENFITGAGIPLKNVRVISPSDFRKEVDEDEDFWVAAEEAYRPVIHFNFKKVKTLRKDQEETLKKILEWESDKGYIIRPTGSGKTLIFLHLIYRSTQNWYANKSSKIPVNLVFAPSIALAIQHLEEFYEQWFANPETRGLPVHVILNNSGVWNTDEVKNAICFINKKYSLNMPINDVCPSQLTSEELRFSLKKYADKKIPVVIFSCYQSANKIPSKGFFDEIGMYVDYKINDECHNLVEKVGLFSETEKEAALAIEARKAIGFTATKAYKNQVLANLEDKEDKEEYALLAYPKDRCMSNKLVFGEKIDEMTIFQSNNLKLTLPVYFRKVEIENSSVRSGKDARLGYDNAEVVSKAIETAMVSYDEFNAQYSKAPSKNAPKILAGMGRVYKIQDVIGNNGFEQTSISNGINVRACCSKPPEKESNDYGYFEGYGDGWDNSSNAKLKLVKAVNSLPRDKAAVVLHCFMLTQGIDVKGFNSRIRFDEYANMGDVAQEIGRIVRIVPEDEHLRDDPNEKVFSIDKNPSKKWVKPFAIVYVPVEKGGKIPDAVHEFAYKLFTDCGYNPWIVSNGSDAMGVGKDDPPVKAKEMDGRSPSELWIKESDLRFNPPEFSNSEENRKAVTRYFKKKNKGSQLSLFDKD